MSEPLRLALVGCGGISKAHLAGFRALGELGQVTVCCDLDPAAAAARAAELPGARAAVDYAAVLADPSVDAVDLCLPHDLHAPYCVAAAEAGKHVFVEKPMARTLDEATAMIEACRAAGVVLMIGHCQRFSAERQTARRLVAEGAIGEVYLMRSDHNQWVAFPDGHWGNDPQKLGGGAVAGSGVHHLDTLRWFLGDVASVTARFAHNGLTPRTAEDAGVIVFEHASGAVGEATIVWTAQRFPWYEGFWIYGRGGVIHNIGGLHLFTGSPREGSFRRVECDHDDAGGFREELRHFLHCIRDGRRPRMDGEEGRAALELVLAAQHSVDTGQTVRLPLES
ncbi:MAG: Gfo/Idh/MocA family oxidoreductase [Fimbriimonadaceae bacterium]|nr:Gfo/Idh/MocA family oxidoreductase [Fimbriimonadaceae bacterium]